MKIVTPHGLVRQVLDVEHLTQQRLDRAVRSLMLDGWVLAYHPAADERHRPVSAERTDHPVAELMQASYTASVQKVVPIALVSHRAVEGAVRLSETPAGRSSENGDEALRDFCSEAVMMALARRGLAVVKGDDSRVGLRGTSPQLAQIVNTVRLGRQSRGGWSTHRLVQAALGLRERPRQLTVRRLVLAEEAFKPYLIDARDLLHGRRRTHLRGVWHLTDLQQTQAA